jgi:hypothetical protein
MQKSGYRCDLPHCLRGDDGTKLGGKFGRAAVGGRFQLVVLSSNCLRFDLPHCSARQ